LWIEGDNIRLTQIFENLLTNAAKYTDRGGQLGVTAEQNGEHAVVRITDNGLGIAPGMQNRIFDLFVQDERAVDRSQGGLGIGLALVRHLVHLHHGEVQASSEGLGKGCEFVVRLPLLPVSALRAPAAGAASSSSTTMPTATRARPWCCACTATRWSRPPGWRAPWSTPGN
jgi:two-component system CheB/CheR fusion protein